MKASSFDYCQMILETVNVCILWGTWRTYQIWKDLPTASYEKPVTHEMGGSPVYKWQVTHMQRHVEQGDTWGNDCGNMQKGIFLTFLGGDMMLLAVLLPEALTSTRNVRSWIVNSYKSV